MILRVNADTQILVSDIDRFDVRRGAIYLDTRAGAAPPGDVEINTPFGIVRHLGTQYEVGVRPDDLRLRVREGAVTVSDGAREYVGDAGEQLVLARDAEPVRSSIAPSGPEWAWVESLATLPTATQYRLIDLLEWIARETGRELQFASDTLALTAARDTLVGAAGLNPSETLDVIRSTTGLQIELAGRTLLIR
jgi:ferric-dicitrate binding protein FerR (iron transport regulator)